MTRMTVLVVIWCALSGTFAKKGAGPVFQCQELSHKCVPGSMKEQEFCCGAREQNELAISLNPELKRREAFNVACASAAGSNGTCCKTVPMADEPGTFAGRVSCTPSTFTGKKAKPCCDDNGAVCGSFKHEEGYCCLPPHSSAKCQHKYEAVDVFTGCCDDARCNETGSCVLCGVEGDLCEKGKPNGGCCRFYACNQEGKCNKCTPPGGPCVQGDATCCLGSECKRNGSQQSMCTIRRQA